MEKYTAEKTKDGDFKVYESTTSVPTSTIISKEALEEAIAYYQKEVDWRQAMLDSINKLK